ncbi:MAG: HAD family phosphatase [Romboutsia sp.]|nr:HAD family phosphatase [Romboutsia sp.]
MIKLIASDMDGTLLNSNKQLSKSVYDILKKLNDKGIIFVAISGRDIFSLKKIFKDVKEDIVYASNNGNYITYKGKVIFENYIENNMVDKVAKIIRKKAKHNTIYCAKDSIYSESIIPVIVGKKLNLKVKYIKDIMKIEDKILKISTFGRQKIINRALEDVSILNDKLMITKSGSTCFDIWKLGGTKKQGINILQNVFNVKYEDSMVFGDHMNDLEMMSSGYYSYAMENAEEEVKRNARFIAGNNDNDGVINVIKDVVFKERLNDYSI